MKPRNYPHALLALTLFLIPGCSGVIENEVIHRPLGHSPVLSGKLKVRPASERVNRDRINQQTFVPVPIEGARDTYLGLVEFTDQGMLKQDEQFAQVRQFLKKRPAGRPLVLVIFVHGWNHNAAPHDGNLLKFRKILTDIRAQDKPDGDIVGVYLGWPGNVHIPLPQLSFYSRLNAAQRVSGLTCTEVILSLIAYAKTETTSAQTGQRRNVKTIVVGHSMGGMIVERSLVQAMIGYGITNAPTQQQLKGLKEAEDAAITLHQGDQETLTKKLNGDLKENMDTAQETLKGVIAAIDGFLGEEVRLQKTLSNIEGSLKDQGRGLLLKSKSVKDLSGEIREAIRRNPASEPELIALADAMHHSIDDSYASVCHCLDALAGWMAMPNTEIDSKSKDFKRSSADAFLQELTPDADMPHRVSEALKVLKVKDPASATTWEDKVQKLFGKTTEPQETTRPTEVQWKDLLSGLMKGWSQFKEARSALTTHQAKAEFAKLKEDWKAANAKLELAKDAVTAATRDRDKSKAKEEAAKGLAKKLNLLRERPPADLVILINPASPAMLASQMKKAWEEGGPADLIRKHWHRQGRPWIISISSDFDGPTRKVFPFAMNMASWFGGGALTGDERNLAMKTAPHLKDLCTHHVKPSKKPGEFDVVLGKDCKETPLWVVKADRKTVPNHNDIFTKEFQDLVRVLLRKSQVFEREPPATDRLSPPLSAVQP